jgi:hypothetical protein
MNKNKLEDLKKGRGGGIGKQKVQGWRALIFVSMLILKPLCIEVVIIASLESILITIN